MLARLIRSLSHTYVAVLNASPLRATNTTHAVDDAPEAVSTEMYPFF